MRSSRDSRFSFANCFSRISSCASNVRTTRRFQKLQNEV